MIGRTLTAAVVAAWMMLAGVACGSSIPATATGEGLISEDAAIATAMAGLQAPAEMELVGQLGEAKTWRMSWGEFQVEFDAGADSRDRGTPMWVVQVQGTWRGAGIVPPESRTTWSGYGLVAVSARDGTMFAMTFVEEAVR